MEKNKNYLNLKKFSFGLGIDLFGVADIGKIKKEFALSGRLLEKLDKAISLGLRLSAGILEEINCQPTRLYFYHYKTANALLDQLTFKVSNSIQKKGYLSVPIPASQIVNWQKQSAHLSHKKIAHLAGLGWIGRNNLLVNKGYGSQFRLSTILTDMPLKLDKPAKQNCAVCFNCLKACPAQAIKNEPSGFDYIKCFDKLKEFQKQRLVDQYICGACVNACGPELTRKALSL